MSWESVVDGYGDLSRSFRRYLGLGDRDVELVRKASSLLDAAPVLDSALKAIEGDREAVRVAMNAGLTLERARELLESWLRLTLEGSYNEEHAVRVLKVGLAHARAGAPRS